MLRHTILFEAALNYYQKYETLLIFACFGRLLLIAECNSWKLKKKKTQLHFSLSQNRNTENTHCTQNEYFPFLMNVCCKNVPSDKRLANYWHMHRNADGFHVKCQVFLSDFNQNWNEYTHFSKAPPITLNRNSVVGTATGYGLDDRGVGVRVPVTSRIVSPSRPDRLWGPPSLPSNGYRGLFPRG
jgi:hypothetical protein